MENHGSDLDILIYNLRQNRDELQLSAPDFEDWSIGARFYPMLYMLTRVQHAQDWETGIELTEYTLGQGTSLELHHIFPKSLLYAHGYERRQVNQIANFTFLTQDTNRKISNHDPASYLSHYARKTPDVLASHWIPADPALWQLDRYLDFLQARRQLLADAANQFLHSLFSGLFASMPVDVPSQAYTPPPMGGIVSSEEETLLRVNVWVDRQGLPQGVLSHELVDQRTGQLNVVLDLAWPEGLQAGYSQPVALLIDEDQAVEKAVNQADYRFFTTPEDLKSYVRQEILAVP